MTWLRIDPADNVLIGGQRICRYLGVKSYNTLYRWIELYALPVVKRPDGQYMTTMTAIDQWLFRYAEVLHDRKAHLRAANCTAQEALERLQRQIDRDALAIENDLPVPIDGFAYHQAQSMHKAMQGVGLAPKTQHRTTVWRHARRTNADLAPPRSLPFGSADITGNISEHAESTRQAESTSDDGSERREWPDTEAPQQDIQD